MKYMLLVLVMVVTVSLFISSAQAICHKKDARISPGYQQVSDSQSGILSANSPNIL